ncbi:hypothetical protein BDZ91DRAFT_751048 [Kalaharituber pfeilii]|nr:hypothetical protein BDZ91DRAFT_751048 [Kalaharituber pfeilii]
MNNSTPTAAKTVVPALPAPPTHDHTTGPPAPPMIDLTSTSPAPPKKMEGVELTDTSMPTQPRWRGQEGTKKDTKRQRDGAAQQQPKEA